MAKLGRDIVPLSRRRGARVGERSPGAAQRRPDALVVLAVDRHARIRTGWCASCGACAKPRGHIVILNRFSGGRFWWLFEHAAGRLADRPGFRSGFSYEVHILAHDWQVESVAAVNLMALSRLVVIRNVGNGRRA